MKNLESFSGATNQEGQTDPFLEQLWKSNHFIGRAPFKGSVAETRLKEACEAYINLVDNPEIINPALQNDSENYFAKPKIDMRYDSRRRELHNLIAIMVVGEQRSGMKESLALKIADFARAYVSGK